MCLIPRDGAEIQEATRHIVCYKVLNKFRNNKLRSVHYPIDYELGETKTAPCFTDQLGRKIIKRKTAFEINQGLHSYSTLSQAQWKQGSGQVIVRCYIPKGTKYIKGIGNEYVSLALKITSYV